MKKKSKWLYRLRAFVLALLFIFPCFIFLACDSSSGSGGSGGGFGEMKEYTDPKDRGMLELSSSNGISLKYLYKPQDLSPYYEKMQDAIFNSAENILTNLVGEYGCDDLVNVYNDEYIDSEPATTSLEPFKVTSDEKLKTMFNGVSSLGTIRKTLAKAEYAHYNTGDRWYAIATKSDIPANFVTKDSEGYKLSVEGTLTDLKTSAVVSLSDPIPGSTYEFRKSDGETVVYLWLGDDTSIVSTTGGKVFTEKLLDTHFNGINRSVTSVSGESGGIVISKEAWEWKLEEWSTSTFLEEYLEKYKNRLAAEIGKIIAYGENAPTGNAASLYSSASADGASEATVEQFIQDCVLRIDHIGISESEAELVTDFIVENVIGVEDDKYSNSGSSSSGRFDANEISDNLKRITVVFDEETGELKYNNKVVTDESVAGDVENGFKRKALFKNYYNTTRASLERTRLVYPEIPIVDYVDIAYDSDSDAVVGPDEDEPANGKIQSIVITNTGSADLQIASISFMIVSVHNPEKADYTWDMDTLDISIYANYYHDGKLEKFSLDSLYLSKEDPSSDNTIDSKYGTLDERTYNIYDVDDSPAFVGKNLVLSKNTNNELDTNDWAGSGVLSGEIDMKNSVTEKTFKNFKGVNYDSGSISTYNGGGDYLEICFVVASNDIKLSDFYSYSIIATAIYGKNV